MMHDWRLFSPPHRDVEHFDLPKRGPPTFGEDLGPGQLLGSYGFVLQ